jgi:hypothetical protein
VQNNRLAVDWPEQMVYELYPPDDKGIWVFRITDKLTLRFNELPDGTVESLTFYEAGKEFLMASVEGESLPGVDEILAIRRIDKQEIAFGEMVPYEMTGTTYIAQSGVKGEISITIADKEHYRVDADYGKYGSSHITMSGDYASTDSSFGPFDELHGKYLEQMKQGHPEALFGDWRYFFESIKVLRVGDLDGQKVYVLALQHGELPPITLYIDTAIGDVLKSEAVVIQQGGIAIPVTTLYEDYRELHGIRIPFREISSNEQTGRSITQWENIEVNIDVDDGLFTLVPTPSN